MKYSLFLPFGAFAILISSCASVYRLSETPRLADVVNSQARGRESKVGLDSIDFYRAHYQKALDLRIGRDSVYWIDPESLQSVVVPRERLAEVTMTDGWRGVGHGALGGVGLGAVAGLAAAISFTGPSKFLGPNTAAGAGVMTGIAVALPSALVGSIIGGLVGAEDRYELLLPPDDSRERADDPIPMPP